MSDIIFLQPASSIPASLDELTQHCRENFMSHLRCNVVDEDLLSNQAGTTFKSKNSDWLSSPSPRVRLIDDSGVESLKFETADYTVNYEDGSITFGSAVTDIVRVDYSFFPWGTEQLTEFVASAISELRVLIYRPVDENNIHSNYRPVICRRTYTKLLEDLLGAAKDYFSVSVAGRNINKSTVVSQINLVIDQNEKQFMQLVEALRHYNTTSRILPTFSNSKTIRSDAEVA